MMIKGRGLSIDFLTFNFWFYLSNCPITHTHPYSHVKFLRNKLTLYTFVCFLCVSIIKKFIFSIYSYTHPRTKYIRTHSFKWQLVPHA